MRPISGGRLVRTRARLPGAISAEWIFPTADRPIRNATLEIDASGRIVAVRAGRDADASDLGRVAVIPALVNAHAHLEFSDLSAPIKPSSPFPAWLKGVIAHRRERREPVDRIVRQGMGEAKRAGTAALGEIVTSDPTAGGHPYGAADPEIVAFREIIGLVPDDWDGLLASSERFLRSDGGPKGLSPHAPYTVPQQLFERSIAVAVRNDAPVAVHLAEIPSERDLLARGDGELVEMLRSLGLWRSELHEQGRRPLDWLHQLRRVRRGLVIHGNHLDDEELDFIAESDNLTLVHCPRTHAYFGRPTHTFRRLLARGGRVALGTDGRSSNPDLDLWQEGRFLRRLYPDLGSDTILDLITRRGAEALGVDDRHGVLVPGRAANFVVIRLKATSDCPPDLFSPDCDRMRVFRNGIECDCHDGGPICLP